MNPVVLVLVSIGLWVVLTVGLLALVGAASNNGRYDEAFEVEPEPVAEPDGSDGEVFAADFDAATDQAISLASPRLTTQLTDAQVDAAFAKIRAGWLEGSK